MSEPITTQPLCFHVETSEAISIIPLNKLNWESWRDTQPARIQNWLSTTNFTPNTGKIGYLPNEEGHLETVLFGMGNANLTPDSNFIFGGLPHSLPNGIYRLETAQLSTAWITQAALGWLLGSYQFTRYTDNKASAARLIAPKNINTIRIERIANAVAKGRDLINTPAEDMGPAHLQAELEQLAQTYQATLTVTKNPETLTTEFPLISAVGRAGMRAPRLLDLRWGNPAHPQIALVGKGVCYDTGGLNLKPGNSMRLMKKDMGGAATAFALAQMIMDAKLPIHLRLLIPAVENNVSANAFRPGDVFYARNGVSVEIDNTDAEGRLVLADALCLATEESPDLLLDFATLTGAARVALGAELPPFFTPNPNLAQQITTISHQTKDPVWQLPLWERYHSDLKSTVADMVNCAPTGLAGAITAALFLQNFTKNTTNWVHFDVYGWAAKKRGGVPVGGEIQAARMLYEVLESRYTGG